MKYLVFYQKKKQLHSFFYTQSMCQLLRYFSVFTYKSFHCIYASDRCKTRTWHAKLGTCLALKWHHSWILLASSPLPKPNPLPFPPPTPTPTQNPSQLAFFKKCHILPFLGSFVYTACSISWECVCNQ